MPKQGYGKRRPEDSPRFTPKHPWAGTDLETRTFTRRGGKPHVQVYKDSYDYSQRVPVNETGFVEPDTSAIGDIFNNPNKKKPKLRKQGYKNLR